MDIQRARQILNVDETITVLHHGSPIWIESVIPRMARQWLSLWMEKGKGGTRGRTD